VTAAIGPVYVASSWRNTSLDSVNGRLRRAGVSTYDFREHDGFHWQDVFPEWGDDWPHNGEMDAPMVLTGMGMEPAERGFARDRDALDACAALVLVLPAGNSAHLELGYAAGQGKPTCVLLPEGTVRPDLMWKVADLITGDVYEMVAWALAKTTAAVVPAIGVVNGR
jgi:hypothetical protein